MIAGRFSSRATGGYSLLEVLLAASILLLVVGLVAATFSQLTQQWIQSQNRRNLLMEGQVILDRMEMDLNSVIAPGNRRDVLVYEQEAQRRGLALVLLVSGKNPHSDPIVAVGYTLEDPEPSSVGKRRGLWRIELTPKRTFEVFFGGAEELSLGTLMEAAQRDSHARVTWLSDKVVDLGLTNPPDGEGTPNVRARLSLLDGDTEIRVVRDIRIWALGDGSLPGRSFTFRQSR